MTEEDLTTIKVPIKIIVGDRDPVRRLYVTPLQEVRRDWPVVEIRDAGHLDCIVKPQFRDEVVGWVQKQSVK